ncbi:hypothetical protein FB451DRAFT_1468458 [Mycena latifolia]|nr:hypothetical protein FB451DRAFT_1468458 [Mycena latifolia]
MAHRPSSIPKPITERSTSLRSAKNVSQVPSSSSAPAAARSQAPTTGPLPAFGSSAPRLPTHMQQTNRRARLEEVEDEGDVTPAKSATYVSASSGGPSFHSPSPPQSAVPVTANSGAPLTAEATPLPSSVASSTESEVTVTTPKTRSISPARPEDSISQALRQPSPEREYEHLFQGNGRVLDIFKEPLYASVEQYHEEFDPASLLADPMAYYGAVNGELPYCDSAASESLRDVLTRYQTPHRNFLWERLSDLVLRVVQYDASSLDIRPVINPATGELVYELALLPLSEVAHAVLAVDQIVGALHAFIGRQSRPFEVDPHFGLTLMLERCNSEAQLQFAFSSLQLRLSRADTHIHGYLKKIREAYTLEDASDRLSSVNSTISEVHGRFGSAPPTHELYRLLQRDDYGRRAALINSEAHAQMMESLQAVESPLPQYYKRRDRSVVPTLREERHSPAIESAMNIAAPIGFIPKPATSASVRFAPNPSAVRRSAISSLPGAGAIHEMGGLSVGAGGPSLMNMSIAQRGVLAVSGGQPYQPTPAKSWTSHQFSTGNGSSVTMTVPAGTKTTMDGGGDPAQGPPVPPAWRGQIPGAGNGGGGNGYGGDGRDEGGHSAGLGGGGYGGNGGEGGGGGGGNGGGGGGGGAYGGNDPAAPGFNPASTYDGWQLNPKLNVSVVPAWDGSGSLIIEYVVHMSHLANMSEKMSVGIAQMAPSKFSDRALRWWNALAPLKRAVCCRDWLHLLDALRRQFLTDKWTLEREREFEEMRFRQPGHGEEDPQDYFQWCLQHHSFLFSDAEDGVKVVSRVLRMQPPEWARDVNITKCPDIESLLAVAEQDADALVSSWKWRAQMDSILTSAPVQGAAPFRRHRKVNAADRELPQGSSESESEEEEPPKHAHASDSRRTAGPSSGNGNTFSGPKPPWPKGKTVEGYEFRRDDSKVSAKPPNGECYICTSPKHVALDCPHRSRWQALRMANLIHVEMDKDMEDAEMREYIAMIVECESPSSYSCEHLETPEVQDRTVFAVDALGLAAKAAHVVDHGYNRNRRRRDKFTKAKTQDKGKGKAVEREDPVPIPRRQIRKSARMAEFGFTLTDEGVKVYDARKVRQLLDGLGSLGARALHVKVRVGSLAYEVIRARMDSGADITLMSEDFWKSIPGLPKPREGIHMKLYHLTGQAKVLRYVQVPIFMETKDGEIVRFELEAYVVRDMRVPLLLGEDFQSAYEIGVQRWATGHSELKIGKTRHLIPASSAHAVDLGFEIRPASMAKTMKRLLPGSVAEDVSALAGEDSSLGPFEGRDEWLVEKIVIATEDESVLAAPTTFITSAAPYIPIANPSTCPWYIRAGDVVGKLHDPSSYADNPTSEEDLAKYSTSAESIACIITETLRAQDPDSQPPEPRGSEDQLDEDHNWGPKTTALAGEFENDGKDKDILEMVNLGPDVPEAIRPRLNDVLRRNVAAFRSWRSPRTRQTASPYSIEAGGATGVNADLQWARVYENANRRLAAWGAVFAAYQGLKIIHRPGRVHSNVDPLSRLPRIPLHDSPVRDDLTTIVPDADAQEEAERAENRGTFAPVKKAAFAIWWWEDVVDNKELGTWHQITERRSYRLSRSAALLPQTRPGSATLSPADPDELPFPSDDPWMYPTGVRAKVPTEHDEDWNKRAHLLISVSPSVTKTFVDGYK